jgi:hypothetical protein
MRKNDYDNLIFFTLFKESIIEVLGSHDGRCEDDSLLGWSDFYSRSSRRLRDTYCLHHHPDDGVSTLPWSVYLLQRDYIALYPKRMSYSFRLISLSEDQAREWSSWVVLCPLHLPYTNFFGIRIRSERLPFLLKALLQVIWAAGVISPRLYDQET